MYYDENTQVHVLTQTENTDYKFELVLWILWVMLFI